MNHIIQNFHNMHLVPDMFLFLTTYKVTEMQLSNSLRS